jgi:serine phosphatase RsbU (regulator of sigma subunit)
MTKSPSQEPSKSSRRKGPRSVSTLTPSQLARKRANDREAQRAIRARTKEHIERLEQELEEAKASQGRDKMVQELIERNKALEAELARLRASMGVPAGAPRCTFVLEAPTLPHNNITKANLARLQ